MLTEVFSCMGLTSLHIKHTQTQVCAQMQTRQVGVSLTLFTRNTTFLPHCLMYFKNVTSLSVKGLSALITNSTRSALGTYSSVRRCCLSKITLVPGVSTTLISRNSGAGNRLMKNPSEFCTRSSSPSSTDFRTLISFVVGRIPSARYLHEQDSRLEDNIICKQDLLNIRTIQSPGSAVDV